MEQETLIYIDDKERYDASAAANFYTDKDTKNRAYINALGAELALKYLQSEDITVDNIKNIHSIRKFLEEFDISDVMLPNIHIDVRVVFDEQAIFVPKSHFDYNLVPDIYVVFQLASDFSHVKFLGFFEPKLINKNNSNGTYYFIEKEKLNSPLDLVKYIKNFDGDTNAIAVDDADNKFISMLDNNISDSDKKYLCQQLTKSADLREKFIEYENFEILSMKAMSDSAIEKPEMTLPSSEGATSFTETVENFAMFGTDAAVDSIAAEELPTDIPLETDSEAIVPEDLDTENIEDLVDEPVSLAEIPEQLDTGAIDAIEPDMDNEAVNLDSIEEINTEVNLEDEAIEAVSLENFTPIDENVNLEAVDEEVVDLNPIETVELPTDLGEVKSEDLPSVDDTSETVSLENFSEISDETPENYVEKDELVSLDAMSDENITENESLPEINDKTEDFVNIEEEPEINEEVSVAELNNDESLFDENYSKTEDEENDKNPSFGNNLLENLAAEDEDNISIEPIAEETAESNELFSQLEDVLTNSAAAEPLEAENISELNEVGDDKLNVLFNGEDQLPSEEINETEEYPEQNYAGAALTREKSSSKNLFVTALLIALLAGASAFVFLKPKNNNEEVEPITTTTTEEVGTTNKISQQDAIETNVPDINQQKPEIPTEVKKEVTELKINPQPQRQSSSAYMSVSKLVWDVPTDLSQNTNVQTYLRSAGKSIKLTLSADLLLATEYAYSNQMKINLILSNNGSVESAKVVSSSGSSQIDNIVLQSVKDTLNVVKPASGAINKPNFNLNLIIYF